MKTKLDILVLTDFFFPEYLGGSARYAADLCDGIASKGHNILVLTRYPKGVYSGVFSKTKYKIVYHNNFLGLLSILRKRTNFVISQHFSMGLVASIFFKKKKLIYIFQGPVAEEYKYEKGKVGIGYYIRKIIEKFVLLRASKVIVISDYMKQRLPPHIQKKAINDGPIHKFKINLLKTPVRGKKIIELITVRRLTERTGIRQLVNLVRKSDRLRLKVIGKGELSKEFDNYKYQNISFLGGISDAQLLSEYKSSDLFVLPSIDLEGFGLVVLEALASGIPVMATKTSGGAADFLSKIDQGLLYDYGCDIKEFEKGIEIAFNAYRKKQVLLKIEQFLNASFYSNYVERIQRKIFNEL